MPAHLQKMTDLSSGKLVGIYSGKQKGEGKIKIASAELIAGHGLQGDSHAGLDPRRQISLFAMETLNQLLAEGFRVTPEQLSANLLTENINLNSLKLGAQLRIAETVLEIVEARTPCRSITRIDNRLPKRLYGQCGQLARIITGGEISTGDDIKIIVNVEQMSFHFGR